jgi:hypothetical protein
VAGSIAWFVPDTEAEAHTAEELNQMNTDDFSRTIEVFDRVLCETHALGEEFDSFCKYIGVCIEPPGA